MITCKECVNLTAWRSGELAERFGAGYECKKNIIMCPTPDDFCSRAERIKECPKCGRRFVKYPNFCPDCGADMRPEPPYKGAKMVEPQKSKGIDLTEWTENLIHPKRTEN